MNFDTLGWVISALTGIASILTLIWTRMDESRTQKGRLRLDQQKYELDTDRTSSDIRKQQAETHLKITEGLRAELEAITERYHETNEELKALKEERKADNLAIIEIFDHIETTINASKANGDIARLINEIRKFRRLKSI
jgi:hypothetical protein